MQLLSLDAGWSPFCFQISWIDTHGCTCTLGLLSFVAIVENHWIQCQCCQDDITMSTQKYNAFTTVQFDSSKHVNWSVKLSTHYLSLKFDTSKAHNKVGHPEQWLLDSNTQSCLWQYVGNHWHEVSNKSTADDNPGVLLGYFHIPVIKSPENQGLDPHKTVSPANRASPLLAFPNSPI